MAIALEKPPVLAAEAPRDCWLFSRGTDLGVFLGSALLSLLALAVGAQYGLLHQDTPDWAWIPAVLLIDVAHVYSTAFRVYLDPAEMRRRPMLYVLTPVVGFVVGVLLYEQGALTFWRVLAYLAVFHFVRQQYGWVMLYRAKMGERDGRMVDSAAIYAATLVPLFVWHAALPREFHWLIADDFVSLDGLASMVPLAWAFYIAAMGWYAVRSMQAWLRGRGNPGKDIVVATTAVCWYVGIVAFNSDYAFTVTNVFIHGVPYLALLYFYGKARAAQIGGVYRMFNGRAGLLLFLGVLWAAAFAEELLWDRGVWHQRAWLFGDPIGGGGVQAWLVPLLALPQLMHYVLDGFVWRRGASPDYNLVRRS